MSLGLDTALTTSGMVTTLLPYGPLGLNSHFFQMRSLFSFPNKVLEMVSQEFFTIMTKRVLKHSVCRQGKQIVDHEQTWLTVQFIHTVAPVLSHSRAGACHRPVASNEQWCAGEQRLERARVGQCAKIGFGVGHELVIECTAKLQWVPSALGFIHTATYGKEQDLAVIACRAEAKVASMCGPCSFGHTAPLCRSQGTIAWHQNHVVSLWPGSPWLCCPLQQILPDGLSSHEWWQSSQSSCLRQRENGAETLVLLVKQTSPSLS